MVALQILADRCQQFGRTREHSAADAVLGNQAKDAFDLIELGSGGRGDACSRAPWCRNGPSSAAGQAECDRVPGSGSSYLQTVPAPCRVD